jgi:YesN/AraC family two-component response regulator
MIKILIADDQTLMRDGLKTILDLEDDFEVVGTACNGREAYELVKETNPDVILMDIRMPILNGVEAAKLIKGEFKQFNGFKFIQNY